MSDQSITIITPTTGKKSLFKAIESLNNQGVAYEHILLWDDKRDEDFLYPDPKTMRTKNPFDLNFCSNGSCRYSVVIPGSFVQGVAFGSSLRSVGLMLAKTEYITFMDDDVWFADDHLATMMKAVEGKAWAYCKRKVWGGDPLICFGIDEFESIGDSPKRKVPYEMVDNNCMVFHRRLGSSGAVLYRETTEYNDDRLMYSFLKQYGKVPGKSDMATVNQICPKRLEKMFRENCTAV